MILKQIAILQEENINAAFSMVVAHGGGSCSAARKQGIIFPPCMESITPNDILKSMEILKIYEKK